MDPTQAIVLKTFSNTAAADFAASQLRSAGLECWITSDDCGGMYPPLGVIKLFVNAVDAPAARDCLDLVATSPELPAESLRNNDPAMATVPPRVFRFNSGLLVGIILGILLHISYSRLWQ